MRFASSAARFEQPSGGDDGRLAQVEIRRAFLRACCAGKGEGLGRHSRCRSVVVALC